MGCEGCVGDVEFRRRWGCMENMVDVDDGDVDDGGCESGWVS